MYVGDLSPHIYIHNGKYRYLALTARQLSVGLCFYTCVWWCMLALLSVSLVSTRVCGDVCWICVCLFYIHIQWKTHIYSTYGLSNICGSCFYMCVWWFMLIIYGSCFCMAGGGAIYFTAGAGVGQLVHRSIRPSTDLSWSLILVSGIKTKIFCSIHSRGSSGTAKLRLPGFWM